MDKSRYQNLIMLFLITVFVAGSGLIVLYGARFYSDMAKQAGIDLQTRSVTLYFNNRFKQNDGQGKILLGEQSEKPVLSFEGDGYFILVYEEDGSLMEQTSDSAQIMSGAGVAIAQISDLNMTREGNRITVSFSAPDGSSHSMAYTLLTGGTE